MMASIRFFKLFDMLARMGYKKTDLKTEIGLSSTTIAKLSKGESVTTDTILRICERFDVQPGDIMEYVPDEVNPRSSLPTFNAFFVSCVRHYRYPSTCRTRSGRRGMDGALTPFSCLVRHRAVFRPAFFQIVRFGNRFRHG